MYISGIGGDRFGPNASSHSLYRIKLQASASYPEGNFGGNQLPDGSISLSPLYPGRTTDLHVRTATGLHQRFLWLRAAQGEFTIFRVLSRALLLHLPDRAGETGRWCAPRRSAGIPPRHGVRRPSPSLRRGAFRDSVRARARARARARVRGPIPALAARRGQARTEDSPARSTAASGTGGPGPPPRGRAGAEVQCPRPRKTAKSGRWGAVKLSAEAGSHLHPRALPSRPRAGRGAPQPEEVRPAEAEPDRAAVPRGDPTRT